MKHLKINTLNNEATDILKTNLVNKKVAFKQIGSAFLLIDTIELYYEEVFKGLWLGVRANMEIQEINNNYDLKLELYIH